MGLWTTVANAASSLLIAGELVITLLVFLGVRAIRRGRRVARHRALMLWSLGLNAVFLAAFLVSDVLKQQSVLTRGKVANPALFFTVLGIHLVIASSALAVAIVAWWRTRGHRIQTPQGDLDLEPAARARHRRISRWYPWLWGFTLATGLALFGVVYF